MLLKYFYWKRDLKKKSIKAEFYDKNKLFDTNKYLDLCYDYPELSLGFQWFMIARSIYKLDAKVAKATKLVNGNCPYFCPCCYSGKQIIEHWTVKSPAFTRIRRPVSDKLNKVIEFFVRNSSTILNRNSNHNNTNVPLDNSIVDNINSNLVNNNAYNNSSVFSKVFNFLLGSRFYNFSSREWKDLCKCQINTGISLDTPFLAVTAALLNSIVPIAFGRQRSLFNMFKYNNLLQSVNDEITVRQISKGQRNQ